MADSRVRCDVALLVWLELLDRVDLVGILDTLGLVDAAVRPRRDEADDVVLGIHRAPRFIPLCAVEAHGVMVEDVRRPVVQHRESCRRGNPCPSTHHDCRRQLHLHGRKTRYVSPEGPISVSNVLICRCRYGRRSRILVHVDPSSHASPIDSPRREGSSHRISFNTLTAWRDHWLHC